MPKISAAAAAERRAHILEAARHCFAEHGIHVSVDEICTRAGVSKGAFYVYFDSKDAAIQALLQAHGRLVTSFAALDSAEALTQHLAALTVDRTTAWHRLEVELWAHALKVPALRNATHHNLDSLRRALTTALTPPAGGRAAQVAPGLAAEILMACCLGLVASSALGAEKGGRTADAALRGLINLLAGDGPVSGKRRKRRRN